MNVLIVESPGKVKAINKYLGSDYKVLASFGHIRDLPSKDGSVRPDEDFAMDWEVDPKSSKRLSEIAGQRESASAAIGLDSGQLAGTEHHWSNSSPVGSSRTAWGARLSVAVMHSALRMAASRAARCGSGPWLPNTALAASRSFCEQVINLPLWYGMTSEQVERCASAFEEAVRR